MSKDSLVDEQIDVINRRIGEIHKAIDAWHMLCAATALGMDSGTMTDVSSGGLTDVQFTMIDNFGYPEEVVTIFRHHAEEEERLLLKRDKLRGIRDAKA